MRRLFRLHRLRCPNCQLQLSIAFIARLELARATPCPRCEVGLRRETLRSALQVGSPTLYAGRLALFIAVGRPLIRADELLPRAVASDGDE